MINFNDIHLGNYFTSQYLFKVDRFALRLSDWAFLAAAVLLVVLAIVLKLVSMYASHPVRQKMLNRVAKIFLITGCVEALWFGFRYQNAAVLGTHIVAIGILLTGALCLVRPLRYYFRKYRAEKDQWDKQQVKLKYLTKS